MPKAMVFIFSYIFPYAFVIAGGVLLVVGARQMQNGMESREWPGVPGKVLESKVTRHTSRDSDGHSSTSYKVEIEFAYEVDGQALEGDQLAFGQMNHNRKSQAEAKRRQYPKGKEVTVYYKPGEPETSVLETGITAGVWLFLGLGLLFFSIGTVMSIVLPRTIRRAQQRFGLAFATAQSVRDSQLPKERGE